MVIVRYHFQYVSSSSILKFPFFDLCPKNRIKGKFCWVFEFLFLFFKFLLFLVPASNDFDLLLYFGEIG